MKKLVFFALLIGGVWWYATHKFDFHDTLVYAKKNGGTSWAPGVDYSVGLVYYQRTDYPHAKEAFTQLLTDYPTSQYTAHALLRLADTDESLQDWQGAKEAYDRYLQDFPNEPDVNIAQKRREYLYNK